MKLRIPTKTLRRLCSKLVSKIIYREYACEADVQINHIEVEIIDGKIHTHCDVEFEMTKEELKHLIQVIG